MSQSPDLAIIILAAGKGTRMKSNLPKALVNFAGQPILHYVLGTAAALQPSRTVVVVNKAEGQVSSYLDANAPEIVQVDQTKRLGTGHAVASTADALQDFDGTVLILFGDAPLITPEPLQDLLAAHWHNKNAITTLTGHVDAPGKMGRVQRDDAGHFTGTKEAKDCTEAELENTEVATAIFAVESKHLFRLLSQVDNKNNSGEYYLNGIEPLALAEGLNVEAKEVAEVYPLLGCNSREELAKAEAYKQAEWRRVAMANGATLRDPKSVFLSGDTQLGQDVEIGPNVQFGSNVVVAGNVKIEGNCVLKNCTIGSGSTVLSFCHIDGAAFGEDNVIGPHAHIRKGTETAEQVEIGCFVTTKKASFGKGSKAKHHASLSDAKLGADVNIAGGTIAANYHHLTKQKAQTIIEDGAATGANSTLIAPVKIGAGAFVAGGATIWQDVPSGALAKTDAKQINTANYQPKKAKE